MERQKYLNDDQLKAFITQVEKRNLRDEVLFKLALYLGLRVQEVCNIQLKDIQPDSRAITIQGVKNGRLRTYPDIEDKLWKKLKRYSSRIDSEYLFPSKKRLGQKMTTAAIQRLFKLYANKAGLPSEFSIHSLRHSCGILMARGKFTAIQIQMWLRHRSIMSTQVYFEQVSFERDGEQVNQEFASYL